MRRESQASDRPHSASSLWVIDGKGMEELPISAAIMTFEPHASEDKLDDMCDLCVLC